MSTHINAAQGEIAEIVLMPGDPLRAKYIAENFLENPVCYNNVRGMLGFTGTYKGVRISVQGSGMGMPSLSIYANELIRFYGAKKLIRVGSCGAMQPHLKVRDVILAQGSCSTSNLNKRRFGELDFSPIANFELLYNAYESAKRLQIPVHVGNILSEDSFYEDNNRPRNAIFAEYGVLAVEMETAELYTLAAKHGVQALCVLTVSDHILTQEETTAEEREKTFAQMIEIVLESLIA
ncbi:MAG: purine-nucleoside phosphorylase [Bacillota bacterium]|nr:purine-nucleoside phosphorylase [Bacillota bacterium]